MQRSRQGQIVNVEGYWEEMRREPRTELFHTQQVTLVINRDEGPAQTLHADLLDLSEGGASMALGGSTELTQGEQGRAIKNLINQQPQTMPFEVRWVHKNPEITCIGVAFIVEYLS